MTDAPRPQEPPVPSWQRWPPNCCETCTGWVRAGDYVGRCEQRAALAAGTQTDSRFRCPAFRRKED